MTQPALIDVGGGTVGGTAAGTARGSGEAGDGTPADQLSALLEAMEQAIDAGHPVCVNLARITPSGREPVKRFDGDSFDPFAIGDVYGSGRYLARLKVAGKFVKSATFPVAGPARGAVAGAPAPAPAWPAPAPASMPAGDLTTAQLFAALMTMTQAQMQAQTQLISAILSRDNGPKLAELLPLLKPERSNVGELIAGLKELRDIAPDGDGGGGGGSDLSDLAALFGPALAAMANQPAQPARPALPPRPAAARRLPAVRVPAAPVDAPAAAAPAAPAPALRLVPDPRPAPVPRVPGKPDTGGRVVMALRAAFRLGMMPDTAAGMVADVLETADDGEDLAAMAAGAEGPALLAVLTERAPEFAADPARAYALDALEALREYLTAEDEGGDDGDGDEESDDEESDGAGDGDDGAAGGGSAGAAGRSDPAESSGAGVGRDGVGSADGGGDSSAGPRAAGSAAGRRRVKPAESGA